QNFGTSNFIQTADDDVTHGWNNQPYQWEFALSVQHELRQGLSATVGYYRRSFGNFAVIDNLAVPPSEYQPFTITAPPDSKLPGGGGNPVTAFDVNSAPSACGSPTGCFGLVNNRVRRASNYGDQTQTWN